MKELSLYITPACERDIKKLDKDILVRVEAKLKKIANNPMIEGKLLSNVPKRWKNLCSARVGKYSILYNIIDNNILVHAVKHRSIVYDFLKEI